MMIMIMIIIAEGAPSPGGPSAHLRAGASATNVLFLFDSAGDGDIQVNDAPLPLKTHAAQDGGSYYLQNHSRTHSECAILGY